MSADAPPARDNGWSSIADALLAEPVFATLPREDIARFLAHVSERSVAEGEEIQRRGEVADNTFFILDGAFEIAGAGGGHASIEAGFLGEESAIELATYLATATATRESRVIVMPRAVVAELAEHGPLRERLLASYSGRFTGHGAELAHHYGGETGPGAQPESLRLVIGWILAIVVPAVLIWWFSREQVLPNQQSVTLFATLSVTVVMWVFRLLPDFVPALLAVLCIILFGLAPPGIALGGFASKTFFMALSIFGLSIVITVSGLSYRILLWLLRVGPAHKFWYNASLFLTGLALTPVVPTTNGRVAILAPFTNDLLDAMGPEAARREGPRLTASVMGGASLLSAIFLSSKSVNFLIFGLLPAQEEERFHWLFWFYAASVCGVVLLALYALAVWLLFRNDGRPSIPRALVAQQLRILGPMSVAELAAIFGLAVLLLSFLTTSIHHIEIPWVALTILYGLLMFRFLSAEDFRARIDWSFLIFLGSLIGLVATMDHVGLDEWLTENLAWLGKLMAENFESFVLMLAAAIFVVRLALPINATVVIFATLLIPAASNIGVNPWMVGFIILLLSENFIWPYQASYYAQYKSMAAPAAGVDSPRLAVLHALEFLMKLVAIFATFPFWRYLGLL